MMPSTLLMLSIGVLFIAAVLAALAWHRSRHRWRTFWTESARLLLITAAVVLLWQPETEFSRPSRQQREVVVLVDRSTSMQTEDVVTASDQMQRREAADAWINDRSWDKLQPRFKRAVKPFADQDPSQTDLAAAIDSVASEFDQPAAVVVVSDGDFTTGRSPIEAAQDLAGKLGDGLTIYSIPLGDDRHQPDLELQSAAVPPLATVDRSIEIPVTIRNWFTEPRMISIAMLVDGTTAERRDVTIDALGSANELFSWSSDSVGDYQVDFRIDPISGETDLDNNVAGSRVNVRREKLRVLIIESVPRWEYRYLRNALLRDQGIDVSCLLFQPSIESLGGGGNDYLTTLPSDIAEWSSYDVIFVGDVGVASGQLTIEQVEQIHGLVTQQASGLVLMPGPRGNQATLSGTLLADLSPVVMESTSFRGRGDESESVFALTALGRQSLLTQLAEGDQANRAAWQSLPGFYWHSAVRRAKSGSNVLAVHADRSNDFGRLPLLVTGTAGAGKVLFMGTDSAWRWRLGVEDKYHYRFWGQVIRWMAYGRNMATGQRLRLSFLPEQPSVGQSVVLRASVMMADGSPAQNETLRVQVNTPDEQSTFVRLRQADDQWGVYVGQVTFADPGEYDLRLDHPEDASFAIGRLQVRGQSAEQIGRPARPDVMNAIASFGSNKKQVRSAEMNSQLKYQPESPASIVDRINTLTPDADDVRRIQWWNHPAMMIVMIVGLSLFWLARKWTGVI